MPLSHAIASDKSIASTTYEETCGLDQVVNFATRTLDLDGDGVLTGAGELDEDNTFNGVNEWLARDTDDDGADDSTLTYNDAGHLTERGPTNDKTGYVYDVWGRLVKITYDDGAGADLVARYRYNGLGHLVARTTTTTTRPTPACRTARWTPTT